MFIRLVVGGQYITQLWQVIAGKSIALAMRAGKIQLMPQNPSKTDKIPNLVRGIAAYGKIFNFYNTCVAEGLDLRCIVRTEVLVKKEKINNN